MSASIARDALVQEQAALEQQQATLREQYQQVEGALRMVRHLLDKLDRAEAEAAAKAVAAEDEASVTEALAEIPKAERNQFRPANGNETKD